MARKPAADTAALRAHTAALKRHSKLLERHVKKHAAATKANRALASALESQGAALALSTKLGRETIRLMLAQATGNSADALRDTIPVLDLFAGSGQIKDVIMSNINNKFWPNASKPRLRFKEIKALKIGELISKIQKMS